MTGDYHVLGGDTYEESIYMHSSSRVEEKADEIERFKSHM